MESNRLGYFSEIKKHLMYFPFVMKYSKSLTAVITDDNQQHVLWYIEEKISERKAKNIVVGDRTISYKGSSSNQRGSLLGGVDGGAFALISKNDQWYLTYNIDMHGLFGVTAIIAIAMGLFMGIGAHIWWVGFVMFFWLCGANWVIYCFRHGEFAFDIAAGIDKLLSAEMGNAEIGFTKKKDERLKSWF